MAFTMRSIHHTFKNIDGSAASGVVVFRLSARITNGGTTYAEQVSIHATLNATGVLTVSLPANDDPTTHPKGSSYVVTFMLNGFSGDEYVVTVPHTASTPITLGTLLPVQEGA